MRKIPRLLLALGMAAMVVTTAGTAAAHGRSRPALMPRATFVYALAEADQLAPYYPLIPSFTDLPATSPHYGYIEAAQRAGIISGLPSGRFLPDAPLTREQVAKIEVLALGEENQAQALASEPLSFVDAAAIPAWARGYIAEAMNLGLIAGYPNGTFRPGAEITAQDARDFLTQFLASLRRALPGTLTITPNTAYAAVGQAVSLQATGNIPGSAVPVYTTDQPGAILQGATFIANAPGNYVVRGYAPNGATGQVTIHVYGPAASLFVPTVPNLVADGHASEQVQVEVLDNNGNVAANDSSYVTLQSSNPEVTVLTPTTQAVQGVATFTVQAGTEVGATAILTASDAQLRPATTQVALAPQTPLRVSVSAASSYLANNGVMGDETFSAVVLDQAGYPMLTGIYPITFEVSGPGTFDGLTTYQTSYAGNAVGSAAEATVTPILGGTGQISVSATSGSLQGSSTGIQATPVGQAVRLLVTASASSVSADTAYSTAAYLPIDTVTVTAVDAHGFPTPWTGAVNLSETLNGATSANLRLPAQVFFQNQTTAKFSVYGNPAPAENQAGTYQIGVTAPGLENSATTLALAAGRPALVSFLSPSTPISLGMQQMSATLTAAIEDAEGNPVAEPGVPLEFTVSGPDAQMAWLQPATTTTNDEGQAEVTLTSEPYIGNSYTVLVTGAPGSNVTNTASSPTISVQTAATSDLNVALNPNGQNPVTAGMTASLSIAAQSPNGAPVTNDTYMLTPSAGVAVVGNAAGATQDGDSYVGTALQLEDLTLQFEGAGVQRVTVLDESAPRPEVAIAQVVVMPGPFAQYILVDGSGHNLAQNESAQYLGFAPGQPTEVWLEATDAYGNQVANPYAANIGLTQIGGIGEFRETAGGADVTSVSLPLGAGPASLFFINDTQGSTFNSLQAN